MPDNYSAELTPLFPREQAENALADALRLFMGKRRRYSYEQVAKGIGYKAKCLYDFLSYPAGHPDHRPLHFGIILSLHKFLGADFTNEWIRLANQGAFELPDDEPNPGDLAADTTDDTAAIVRAAKDGKFDPKERDELPATGARLMTHGAQLIALRRRSA